jgi:hypothetical protein
MKHVPHRRSRRSPARTRQARPQLAQPGRPHRRARSVRVAERRCRGACFFLQGPFAPPPEQPVVARSRRGEVRQVKPRQSFARDAIPSTSPAETAGTAQTSKASMNWASTRGRDGLRQPRKPAETCRRRPALLENHFRTSRKSTGRRPVAKQRRAQKSPRSADRESPSSVGNMTMRSTE